MRRHLLVLLSLFASVAAKPQYLTTDGRMVVFSRAKGDSAEYRDLATGAFVRMEPTNGRDLNNCSFFSSRFFPNGCMENGPYERTELMVRSGEGTWRSMPVNLPKYQPDKGYQDPVRLRYYLQAVPAKDHSCEKHPARLYTVDATGAAWTQLAEFPFKLPRFMVNGDLLLT